jgi:hypothetical protein
LPCSEKCRSYWIYTTPFQHDLSTNDKKKLECVPQLELIEGIVSGEVFASVGFALNERMREGYVAHLAFSRYDEPAQAPAPANQAEE